MTLELSQAISPETLPAENGGEVKVALTLSTDAEPRDTTPVRHIALCLDASGSMRRGARAALDSVDDTRIDHAKAGARKVIDELDDQDHLTVTSFNSTADTVVEPTNVDDLDDEQVQDDIDSISCSGTTDVLGGLKNAWQDLTAIDDASEGVRTIILLSDGKDNKNDEADFEEVLPQIRGEGITVTTAGIGKYDDQLMAKIADGTDGLSHHLTALADIEDFIATSVTAAGNVVFPTPELHIRPGTCFTLEDAGLRLMSAQKDADVKHRELEQVGDIHRLQLPDIGTTTRLMVVLRAVGDPQRAGLTAVVGDIDIWADNERLATTTATVQYTSQETGIKRKVENDWKRITVKSQIKHGELPAAEDAIEDIEEDDEELAIELHEQTDLDKTEL